MVLAGGLMSACGSPSTLGNLRVATSLGSKGPLQVAQGTAAPVTITVTNGGASAVEGVTVRVDVPSGFTYTNTVSVVENGDSVRTGDVAPTSRAAVLTWGSWTIGPGSPGFPSQVVITASLQATGGTGSVTLAPQVFASGSAGSVTSSPVSLQVTAAPSLAFTMRVSPSSAKSGGTITYFATVTNTGGGSAAGTSVSVTLPSDFDYQSTVGTSGDASTSGATYPIQGTEVPTWSGFDVPGQGSGGPGILTLEFSVKVLPDVGAGVYPATASVIAGDGSTTQNDVQLNFNSLAPVEVTGP